jgi:deoxyuridine 5'-triphosphate nucleotidohydrolase
MSEHPDIRLCNRDGVVSATVITKYPDFYNQFSPYQMEVTDNIHVLRYKGSNVFDMLMSSNKKIDYSHEVDLITRTSFAPFKYTVLNPLATPPCRARHSDSGYDLSLITISKQMGVVTLYGTGISVQPPAGFYFDLVPRSSIIKTGYMLANSVGVIDQSYTGEIMVPLIKIDPNAPDIELPCKVVQLIPRRWYGLIPVQDNQTNETLRGNGGFGSTDNSDTNTNTLRVNQISSYSS